MRKGIVWAVIALTILLCIAFFDVVFGGRTLLTSPYAQSVMGVQPPYGYPDRPPMFNQYILDAGASAWQYEPLTSKASQLYRMGHIPLWNASQGFGMPLAANMHSSVFYPPALPLLLSPRPLMWDIYLLIRLLLAGMFTLLFARSVSIGYLGAFGAGAAFMLSGYLLLFVNNSWLNVDVLVPVLLLGIEKVLQGAGRGWRVFLAAAVSAAILGGMPESTFVVFLLAGGYATFRIVRLALSHEGWRALWNPVTALGITAALGVGMSAMLLLPFLEYLQNAWHQHGVTDGTGLRHDRIAMLVTFFLPYVQGPPWGSLSTPGFPRYFSGVLVPIFGLLAILSRRREQRLTAWFFLGAVCFAFAKVYGVGINWIGSWLLFNLVYFPKYLGVVICFSLAVLAGFGLDAVARGQVSIKRTIFATVVVAVICLALLMVYAWWIGGYRSTGYLIRSAGVAAGLISLLQVVLLFLTERRAGLVAGLCAVVLLLELLYLAPKVERPHRYSTDTPPPAVTLVQQDQTQYRVFGLHGVLYPNTSSYFSLKDIRALDALYPVRYVRYVREFINPSVYDRFTGGLSSGPVPERPTSCQANRWFDLLGVKYVFTPGSKGLYGGCDDGSSLIPKVLERTGTSPALRRDSFVIDGNEKPVLFQHPPSEIRFPLRPDEGNRLLSFSVALDPTVWDPAKGDGVLFEIFVAVDARRVPVFSRWADPKTKPEDRRWIDGSVDLQPYLHRDIEIILATRPGASTMWDWAGWGDLRLGESRKGKKTTSQYALVWAGNDLRVYRNMYAFPRAFLIYSVESVADGEAALRRMKQDSFDPGRSLVLEGLPEDMVGAVASKEPSEEIVPVEFERYEDSRVALRALAQKSGVLVLTDVFYPGWLAFLDGKPVPLYAANYAFRGVVVPAGEHKVEFVYRPRSFLLGLVISMGSVLLLFGLLWFLPEWLFYPSAFEHEVGHISLRRDSKGQNQE